MTTICADAVETRGWAASVTMAATVFTVVTAEMLPVGLLTPMSESLHVTDGAAGLALTATGVTSAVAAPVLPLMLGRLDRRAVLGGLMVLLAASAFAAAITSDFSVLMVTRVLMGISIGGVWLLTVSLARRVVPPTAAGPATSLIFSGIGIASVLGIPAGAYVGELAGWRWAFAGVGVLALVLAVALSINLPSLPPERAVRLRDVRQVLKRSQVRVGLVLVALIVTGHFAAYTYIRPLLEPRIAPVLIGAFLLAYGVAGVLGNFLTGALRPHRALTVIAAGIALATLVMPTVGATVAGSLVLLVIWGFAYGGTTVSTQAWAHAAAPSAPESSSAVLVGVYNGSIALGAFTGGQVADRFGVATVTWLPAVLATAALVVLLAHRRQRG
ncbi:putative MFS family arabinose efflux permease [Kribbella aluminosa]|uniref:MFS family arabinose efflux permease n=1 Tax=Kribbella aluminosa TaxID=416017 RepID=A0ABS4UE76_9ACTN|nr:MFS transporter [Kribbella aluminosa]MBP2349905.1 putative MFS family arabinose efflux permease [Kribbella aluminosa]